MDVTNPATFYFKYIIKTRVRLYKGARC